MAEACSQAAVVSDHHHHDDSDSDSDATMRAGEESSAVYGELRQPLSLCYAAADKVVIVYHLLYSPTTNTHSPYLCFTRPGGLHYRVSVAQTATLSVRGALDWSSSRHWGKPPQPSSPFGRDQRY